MKKPINGATSVKTLERDLKIASSILDGRWAIYGVISESGFLAGKRLWVKSIRPPAGDDERKDWLIRFDRKSKFLRIACD